MRIESVAIENWRNIRRLSLDLAAPLTILVGPNEAGKSSVQEAIRHAFLVEASSGASELKELVAWGSSAKAHVELIFTSGAGERIRIEKSFPKGEARLYLDSAAGEALLAEGRAVQEKIFELIGIPAEAADLLTLLWIGQGEGLELFGKKGDDSPLTGAAQTFVKSIIKENLLSGKVEELLRELEGEYEEIFQKSGRPKKHSLLAGLEEREAELARSLASLDEEIEAAGERGEELAQLDREAAALVGSRERESKLRALLEAKHEAEREIEPKRSAFAKLEEEHTRLVGSEERSRRAAEQLPGPMRKKRQAVEEWIGAIEERRQQAEELEERLDAIRGKIEGARLRDRKSLEELEERGAKLRESRVRLEASKLTVEVKSPPGGAAALRISRDEAPEESVTVDGAAEWAAMRSVRLSLEDGLEIEAFGPLSREAWEALTGEIAGEEELLQGRLEELECEDIEDAREALEAYEHLAEEKRRLETERALLLGGEGFERELSEAKGAREEVAREEKRLAELGVKLEPDTGSTDGSGDEKASAAERIRRLSNLISVALRDLEESRREHSDILGARSREELTTRFLSMRDELGHEEAKVAEMEPKDRPAVSLADLKEQRDRIDRLKEELGARERRRSALIALQSQSEGVVERRESIEGELETVRRNLADERQRVGGIELLINLMKEERASLDRNIVAPLQERLSTAFREVVGERYARIAVTDRLKIGEIEAPALRDRVEIVPRMLSYGTREQLSFLFRLLLAQYLSGSEPQVMMLDDTFVNTDEVRRKRLFEMMANEEHGVQFILFTCHRDHYEQYREHEGVSFVDMVVDAT